MKQKMSPKKLELKQKIENFNLTEMLQDFFTKPDPIENREYNNQFLTVVAHVTKSDPIWGDKSNNHWLLSPNVKSWDVQILCDGTTFDEYMVNVHVEYKTPENGLLGERFTLYHGPSSSYAMIAYRLFNTIPTYEDKYQTHSFHEWVECIKSKLD
jgi:hypothetical protein